MPGVNILAFVVIKYQGTISWSQGRITAGAIASAVSPRGKITESTKPRKIFFKKLLRETINNLITKVYSLFRLFW